MKTPIYSSLINYVLENNIRLHMPGHIGKSDNLIKELQLVAKLDVTEIPGIDDFHLPVGAIKEAFTLLARAYNAKESIFLVNGATSGVQAIFLALAKEGKKILIPRNAHRSFYGGLVLSGLWPVYVESEVVPSLGLTTGVAVPKVAEALEETPDIIGVFFTSPSYYGTTINISQIATLCREYNLPLLIDEAHGSHFPFHPLYPTPALKAGADVAVNGLHKSLPVLNQGACLHIADTCTFNKELQAAVSLITTTSPSFPILASIDIARTLMEEEGERLLEDALNLSKEYKNKINAIKGLNCLSAEFKDNIEFYELDPLKVTVIVNQLSIDGYEVAKILQKKYNIQVELAQESIILAMFSIFHTRDDWNNFYLALKDIANKYYINQITKNNKLEFTLPLSKVVISPRQAFFSKKRSVKLEESSGLIAGEMVALYPPGIPALLPGELITAELLDYLYYIRANKRRVQGPKDKDLFYIDIIE